MKKICLAGIALLSALLIAACGGFLTEPEAEKLGFAGYENGQAMVNVAIGGGGAERALTGSTDRKAEVFFYEVVFKNGTNVYRATWIEGVTATLRVPVGTYDTADKAILFAGTSDKTLIAVGLLTATSDGGTSTLTTATTSVTFTLLPLLNNINTTVADSTFQSSAMTEQTTLLSPQDSTTPIHPFPKATPDIAATYQIYIGGAADGVGDQVATHSTGMIIDLDSGTPFSARNSSLNGGIVNIILDNLSINAGGVTPFPNDGTFALEFDTPDLDGYAELYFNIETYAISKDPSPTTDTPIKWFIKGGLNNVDLDGGVAADSKGGVLLLSVGDAEESVDFTIGGGF